MDMKKFYKDIKGIVLYPGTLDELNRTERISGRDRVYELMPQKGSIMYITGVIIPSPSEVKEIFGLVRNVGMAFAKPDSLGLPEDDVEEQVDGLENMLAALIGNREMINMDIRLRAKKIGANGLIHVHLYSKEGSHMGIPVVLGK